MAQINLGGSIGIPGSQSVLGNVVINMTTSDYTMSSTEFSNKFIKVNGAIGANRNLIAPLNQGQEYVVWNNTTGGFSVKIVGATGTGVTIAPGNFITVVCDGSNYQQTSGSGGGSFTANGDLAGTPTDQEVVGLLTFSLPTIAGVTNGNGYLNWTGSAWSYNNPSGAITLSGDVTGSASSNTVQKIQHISISNAAILDGYVLTATGPSNAAFQPGLVFSGDLVGNLTTQSVVGLQSVPVSNLTPTTGQVLQYNTTISGKWAPASYPSLAGDVTGSFTSNSVSKLQGYTLLIASTPNNGDVLTYNTAFSRWAPAPTSGVFVAAGDLTGTSTNQTVVSAQNNTIQFGASTGITYVNTMLFPGLAQANRTDSGATGKTLSIAAQSCTDTGTGTTGGSLVLTSGSGDIDGYIFIETGGTTKVEITPVTTSISTTNVQLSAFTTGIPQFGSSGFISSYPVVMTGTPTTGQVLTATSSVISGVRVLDWETPTVTPSTTWANDLAGSTYTNQYVAAISGNAGAGGTIPINATSLSFGATQTTPSITQSSTAGTSTNLTISAQNNTAGAVGGNLSLLSGTSSFHNGSVTVAGDGSNQIIITPGASGTGNVTINSGTELFMSAGTASLDMQGISGAVFNSGMTFNLTKVTGASYTIDSGSTLDYYINCNFAGAIALTLPQPANGRTLVIKDWSGAAGTNNITISGYNVDGASSYVINTNYGSVILAGYIDTSGDIPVYYYMAVAKF